MCKYLSCLTGVDRSFDQRARSPLSKRAAKIDQSHHEADQPSQRSGCLFGVDATLQKNSPSKKIKEAYTKPPQRARSHLYRPFLLHTLQSPQFSLLLCRLHAFAANQPQRQISSIILAKLAPPSQKNTIVCVSRSRSYAI